MPGRRLLVAVLGVLVAALLAGPAAANDIAGDNVVFRDADAVWRYELGTGKYRLVSALSDARGAGAPRPGAYFHRFVRNVPIPPYDTTIEDEVRWGTLATPGVTSQVAVWQGGISGMTSDGDRVAYVARERVTC